MPLESPTAASTSTTSMDEAQVKRVDYDRLLKENEGLKRLIAASRSQAGLSPSEPDVPGAALSIVIMGASGDLAKKKTFPSLFELFAAELIPATVNIVGFARSELSLDEFRSRIGAKLRNGDKKNAFLQRCTYFAGAYDSESSFAQLSSTLARLERDSSKVPNANRLFYLAIPPNVFLSCAKSIRSAAVTSTGWNRIVVEKPFGRDYASAAQLGSALLQQFSEQQLFRIDHYLGKELVQNLMALRFANSIFEPLWDNRHIQLVTITFKENIGTEGRGGYFDQFGIIRDVMQNHLTQILALVAMEPPVSRNAEDIRDEKVKVLRCISPINLDQMIVGQYTKDKTGKIDGYLDDPGVPANSLTSTFATAAVFIKNKRWDGVPFILKCGKALDERKAEIRIQFRRPPGALYSTEPPNELVMRVQPNEAIYMKMLTKKPGLSEELEHTELDLTYKHRFETVGEKGLPDAYERLILDAVRGDHNLFVRFDELLAAWSIFTPVLHQLQENKIKPIPYEFGSRGPAQADMFARQLGFVRTLGYKYQTKR